jgi:glycosyltransferase involved in cell wall biosynthesis
MTDIKVTVLCIAYNHEKYIRQCLESIVSQKTDFRYKVVVHDDASTDSTADIIREFEHKYPEIIKPIYQTENQLGKNISVYKEYLIPQIEGDYVAFCEGDDYWTDINKLQIQSDYLDKHPASSACGHNTTIIKESEAAKKALVIDICGGEEGCLSEKTVIDWGYILHLSSIMYRSAFARFPEFFYSIYILDMPMALYLRFCGDIYRFEKTMSAYRFMVSNSWSVKQRQKIPDEKHYKMIAFYKEADKYSEFKYTKDFAKQIILEASALTDSKKVVFTDCKLYYKSLPLSLRIKYIIKIYFPRVFKLLKAIRNKAKGS